MKFSLFACCIFAVGLTRSGVSAAEKDDNCSTNLATRLQNLTGACTQPGYFVKRVELCDGGVWKRTVCDDLWTTQDAVVVCREAGYTTPGAVALYLDQASSDSDTASVVPQCEGSESNISQCTIKLKSANVSCNHNNNNTIAVVACPMSSSSPTFNISGCQTNPVSLALDTDPAINSTTESHQDTSTTAENQATTPSTDVNATSPSTVDTSTDKKGTSSDGATSAPSNGLNLTIIYAAAGAAGGVIVLILVVTILLVVIVTSCCKQTKTSVTEPGSYLEKNTNLPDYEDMTEFNAEPVYAQPDDTSQDPPQIPVVNNMPLTENTSYGLVVNNMPLTKNTSYGLVSQPHM